MQKKTYGRQGDGLGEGIVREFGMDTHVAMLRVDNRQGRAVQHRGLFSVTWQPGWEGIWGRRDTCVCMAESLCCSPETITTSLIGNVK